jgi:hypothetical protein
MSDNGNSTAPNTTAPAAVVTAFCPGSNNEDDGFDPGCLDREDSDGDSYNNMEMGEGEEGDRDGIADVDNHQDGIVGYTGNTEQGGSSEPMGSKGSNCAKIVGQGVGDPNLKTATKKTLRKMEPPPTLATEDGSLEQSDEKTLAFKQQYNVIRAQRARQSNGTVIGNVGPFSRVNIEKKNATGINVPGFDIDGDQRQFRAKNFHDARGGKNVSTSFEPEGLSCLACDMPHSLNGRLEREEPVVVVLCDQNFPPFLPTNDGRCMAIVRVEDPRLFELEKTLKEILPGVFDPHGRLPVGSAVLVGSLTHLGSHGLESYAGDLVRVVASVSALVGGGGRRGAVHPHSSGGD